MTYLIYSNKTEAEARSRELLEGLFGGPIASDSTTTHLLSWTESHLPAGGSVLILCNEKDEEALTEEERDSLVGEEEWATWASANYTISED